MTNRDVLVRLRLDPAAFIAGSKAATAAAKDLHDEIDKSNDRTAWLAQGILALAPAAVRMGAGAVPAISGLATQMTVAVAAAGTMALAFNGVGDALGALNDYQLDPSAANMEKLALAMDKIGPAGEDLVRTLDGLGPTFAALANTARGEMFPGVIEGIESFMELAPRFNAIVGEMGEGIGQLASEAGTGLSSGRFEEFFEYFETDAKPILVDMGRAMGNFADGLLNMLVSFGPLSSDFTSGLLDMSRAFVTWSDNLESSNGFQEFVAYVREAGPQTLDFLGSLVTALVALVSALAPLGELSLTGLTAALDTLAALASTPLGPIALSFLSLTAAWGRLNAVAAITGSGVLGKAASGIIANVDATKKAVPSIRELGTAMQYAGQGAQFQSETTKKAMGSVSSFGRAAAPIAGQIGLLTFAMSDLDNKAGLTNTTMLALAGSMFGPWGTAIGAGVGLTMDFAAANDDLFDSLDRLREGLDGIKGAATSEQLAQLEVSAEAANDKLINLSETLNNPSYFSPTDLMTGAKNSIEGLFGRDDYEEAYYELEALEKRRQAAITESIRAQADAAADDAYYNDIMAETAALRKNVAQMRAKRDAAMLGISTELDYASALLDSRKAVKESTKNWNINTEQGNANRRVVLAQASAWNELNRTTGQSPAQAKRARAALMETAQALGASKQEAREYARELLDLPTDVETKIGLDHEAALAQARAVKAELAGIERNIDVYVNVRKPNNSGFGPQIGSSADGSTVPDSGKGYADRFLYMLADREEVISNRRGQADRFRPALKAINADMPPSVIKGMLAGGGTAGERAQREQQAADDRKRRAEEAKARAEERRQREEERRQRRLDAQRTRDLLSSNLNDDVQQESLSVSDARRRLNSAKKADRPSREVNEARLTLKTQQAAQAEAREQRKQQAAEAAANLEEARRRREEEEAEHQRRLAEAVLDGQQAAAQKLMDAAETQLSTAKETAREWAAAMERTGASATAGYRRNLFSDTAAAKASGLSVGPNAQPTGSGWRSALTTDITGLNDRSALIAQLKAAGLSGSAMEALLAEGTNDDVRGMIARGEIAEYAKLFADREALQGAVSTQAAQAAYGAQASTANMAVAAVDAQIAALQARLAEIAAQRPISVYEAVSAQATAAEVARQLANSGAR